MNSSSVFPSIKSSKQQSVLNRSNYLSAQKDCLSNFSYLNQLRNNLDLGYKKSSVYNKSTYEEGYKSPDHSLNKKVGRPKDSLMFNRQNIPVSLHESPKAPSKISYHTPSYKPLTNTNQVSGMSFRGKSIYQSNFAELELAKSLIQKQNPKDHLTGKNEGLGNYVFKSIYNKGYQKQEIQPMRASVRPKDNDHFFYDNTANESAVNFKYNK